MKTRIRKGFLRGVEFVRSEAYVLLGFWIVVIVFGVVIVPV